MQEIRRDLYSAAYSGAKVLITGERGVGKEAVARLIYDRGPRRGEPFAAFDCSSVTEDLLESDLFGDRGWLKVVDGGTLFLQNVDDMSPRVQARLLKFLEDGKIKSGDAVSESFVDVHIIASSTGNLYQCVEAGRFLEDLYYRLNIVHIAIPALRDHRDDVRVLVSEFVRGISDAHRSPPPLLLDETFKVLVDYSWPGNVRELEQVVERIIVSADGGVVEPDDLPAEIRGQSTIIEDDGFSEDDALQAFAFESGAPHTSRRAGSLADGSQVGPPQQTRPPTDGDLDADDEFVSSHVFTLTNRFRPEMKRWGVAAMALLAVGTLAALWMLRTSESRETSTAVLFSRPVPMASAPAPSPPIDARPLPQPDNSVARTVEDKPTVPSTPVSGTFAPDLAPPVATAPLLPPPPADEPNPLPPAVETLPRATPPASPSIIASPSPAVPARPEPEAPAPAAVDRALTAEREAVLLTLNQYEEALEGLNVGATVQVWPSVDRRALERAFSTLKSQGLTFEDCSIVWDESTATAQCDGTLEFVRRVGRPVPFTTQQRWVFRMRKVGSDWQIGDVTASPRDSVARVRRAS